MTTLEFGNKKYANVVPNQVICNMVDGKTVLVSEEGKEEVSFNNNFRKKIIWD